MVRADELQLVAESPVSRGVFDSETTTKRTVMCTVRSVGMRESYEAMSQGLSPSVVFRLALAEDYDDERQVIWNGKKYKVLRTYVAGDGIELTCERWTDDV